jgi:hypothetical protein
MQIHNEVDDVDDDIDYDIVQHVIEKREEDEEDDSLLIDATAQEAMKEIWEHPSQEEVRSFVSLLLATLYLMEINLILDLLNLMS